MKVGNLVRVPPRGEEDSHLGVGGIGIVIHTYSAFPHDMYHQINSCVVTEADGSLSTWYDWQLEIISNEICT